MSEPNPPSKPEAPDPFELDQQLESLLDQIELTAPGTFPDRKPKRPEEDQPVSDVGVDDAASDALTQQAVEEHIEQATAQEPAAEADTQPVEDRQEAPGDIVTKEVSPEPVAAENEAEPATPDEQPGWVADLESVLDDLATDESPAQPETPETAARRQAAADLSSSMSTGPTEDMDDLARAIDDVMAEVSDLEQEEAEAALPVQPDTAIEADDVDAASEALVAQEAESRAEAEAVAEPDAADPDEAALEAIDAAIAEVAEAELATEESGSVAEVTADIERLEEELSSGSSRPESRQAADLESVNYDEVELEGDFDTVEAVQSEGEVAEPEAAAEPEPEEPEAVEEVAEDEAEGVVAEEAPKTDEEHALAEMDAMMASGEDVDAELETDEKAPAAAASRADASASGDEPVEEPPKTRLGRMLVSLRKACSVVSWPARKLPEEVKAIIGYIGLANAFMGLCFLAYAMVF
ncbi:hypothetical protein [Mucisphaera calidilacus]|uniref:Uncharacterized protein n=1 Tax=Mucisphaera calidilacus TaxID=2527982 RepID=A0A518C0D1_9BACT|nr:hypothetical protein [Mucisphaera calidilacus]QDU72676.1 hypothetical protein Pan265_25500 [Mucisphaera calidilacus]